MSDDQPVKGTEGQFAAPATQSSAALKPLLQALRSISYRNTDLELAIWKFGDSAATELAPIARGEVEATRWGRRRALAICGRLSSGADLFIASLADDDRETREIAAQALSRRRGAKVVSALVRTLESDPESLVRICAAESLGEIADPVAFDHLLKALDDDNPGLKGASAVALAKYKDSKILPTLLRRLNERPHDGDGRGGIVEALGALGDSRAIEPLLVELTRHFAWTSLDTIKALGAIGDPRALPAFDAIASQVAQIRNSVSRENHEHVIKQAELQIAIRMGGPE